MKSICSFWLQWVLLNVVGFLISLCFIEIGVRSDVKAIEGAIGGCVIGLAQWLIIRQRVPVSSWWILNSIVSWGLLGVSGFGAIGWIAPGTLHLEARVIFGVWDGVIVGAWLGVGQWLLLKEQVYTANSWIWVSALSWAIALPVGWVIGGIVRSMTHLFLSELVGLAITWTIVSAITGFGLIWLLQESVVKEYS